jgi:hypothetical protein
MGTVAFNILLISGIGIGILILSIALLKKRKRTFAFALVPGGEKRVVITIRGRWDETTAWLDGNLLGVMTEKMLRAGQEFPAPDGSVIKFLLTKHLFPPDHLQVFVNGQPVAFENDDAKSQTHINNAYEIVYFIAFINIFFGILSFFVKISYLEPFNLGIYNVLFGLIFLLLGYFVQRKSAPALVLALLILILDGFAGIILAIRSGSYLVIGSLLARIYFITPMVMGVDAILAIKRTKATRMMFPVGCLTAGVILCIGGAAILWTTFRVPLKPIPLPPAMGSQPSSAARKGNSACYLMLNDKSESVYIRSKAGLSAGKVVDYLEKGNRALVLGTDGGISDANWIFIEVTH